ncbi:Rv3654c family TadE-like protein [Streptomyces sp. NPDC005808]|uniref:Rv3654c family TadE-like protein n=1 Tax=Streptomyces sp. NPDC005808 TaxID=3364734 RepID=UPI0036C98864
MTGGGCPAALERLGKRRRGGCVRWVHPSGTADRLTASRRSGIPAGSDRGAATVWSVGVIAVLCAVFGVVLAMGQVVLVRHRAAGAADLAALAAADHWMDGPTVACGKADRVARAQHARLVRCVLGGEISDVTAASGQGPFAAEVRSRAGPAGPVGPPQPEETAGPPQGGLGVVGGPGGPGDQVLAPKAEPD